MTQWKGYDENYENFSQWLKEKELQVRSETGLRPDLRLKVEQLDNFKVRFYDICNISITLIHIQWHWLYLFNYCASF